MFESRTTLEILRMSIKDWVGQVKSVPRGVYEAYGIDPATLDRRNNIPDFRIAVYEGDFSSTIVYDAYRVLEGQQRYVVDISVHVPERNTDYGQVEYRLMDLKDYIIEWAERLDAYTLTSAQLDYLQLEAVQPISRSSKYASVRIVFLSTRTVNDPH